MHVEVDGVCGRQHRKTSHVSGPLVIDQKKMLAWKDGTMFDWDLLQKWRSPLVCFMF